MFVYVKLNQFLAISLVFNFKLQRFSLREPPKLIDSATNQFKIYMICRLNDIVCKCINQLKKHLYEQ